MTGNRQIWPVGGNGVKVDVEQSTYDEIMKVGKEFVGGVGSSALLTSDGIWEIARRVILADREAREKHDRHARGDFGPELGQALLVATDIGDETDGDAYAVAAELMTLLHKATARAGFTAQDVRDMLELHADLVERLHATDELAVKLQGILISLKGDDNG